MNRKSNFKAPQKALQSSWRDESYSKPKAKGGLIMRSLSNRPHAVAKMDGEFIGKESNKGSYLY